RYRPRAHGRVATLEWQARRERDAHHARVARNENGARCRLGRSRYSFRHQRAISQRASRMGAMERSAVTSVEPGRLLDELARRDRLLELALAAGPALAAADSADAALPGLLRHACASAAWDSARYLAVDEPSGVLRQCASSGMQDRGLLAPGEPPPA